jgi:hypothetical protein
VAGLSVNDVIQDTDIPPGTIVFRLTSPTWADEKFVLNGRGADQGEGRYHWIQQTTSYVSDNVLLCIAEKLYYMNREALRKLANNSFLEFRHVAVRQEVIVILELQGISSLCHVNSRECLFQHQLNRSVITQPDQHDPRLHAVADTLRKVNTPGLIYPSARHSMGNAIAMFGDHSKSIARVVGKVRINLSLVSEDLKSRADDKSFDAIEHRLSHTTGHFAIDAGDFSRFQYHLWPTFHHSVGFLDYLRVNYATPYPAGAVR